MGTLTTIERLGRLSRSSTPGSMSVLSATVCNWRTAMRKTGDWSKRVVGERSGWPDGVGGMGEAPGTTDAARRVRADVPIIGAQTAATDLPVVEVVKHYPAANGETTRQLTQPVRPRPANRLR